MSGSGNGHEVDLTTRWLGLSLRHPVVASASPLSATVDGVLRLADGGAAAVVMASVWEEDIAREEAADAALRQVGSDSHAEMSGYFPSGEENSVMEARLDILRRAAERAGVPVIASLNGCSDEGWVGFAQKLEQAGAAAIELNICRYPLDADENAASVELGYADIVRRVSSSVGIPVAVKMTPFFTSPGNVGRTFVQNGARGLVLFNRFYEPDVVTAAQGGVGHAHLSHPGEAALPLMWLAALSGQIDADLAASTGIWTGGGVVRSLLAGATVAMTASALLRFGPGHVQVLVDGLREWMEEKSFARIEDFRGKLGVEQCPADMERFLRTEYHRLLTAWCATPSLSSAGKSAS